MIKYKIIDNFLNVEECKNLIEDAEKLLNQSGTRQVISNNREITSSTSIEFYKILKNSKSWNNLNLKISSQSFFDDCLKKLDISFNSKYLIDVASHIDGEKIVFYLNETGSPALIKDPVDQDSIFVVMPMKA